MNGTCDASVDLFVTKVVSRLGFGIDQQNVKHLAQVLRCCLERTGCQSAEEYVERFERDREFGRKEMREVVSAVTVSETFFFRHPEQFDALREVVVPTLLRGREPGRELRILSAGCACGEEAYSVAAAVMKVAGIQAWKPRILGVDVNAELLQKARRGHYTDWSLRAVSERERNGCFRRDGGNYILLDALKSMVCFEERNLMDDDAAFWRAGFFDIIFCRNVMIYFSTAAVRLLAARLARCVAPAGFLFLGPSETLRGISHDFHLLHTHGAFYYQRRTADEQSASTAAPAMKSSSVTLGGKPPADDPGWISNIAASGQRIAALPHQSEDAQRGPGEARQTGPEPLPRSHGMDQVRELFQEERFEEALRVIDALPANAAGDPDVLVMQAVLLVNRGELKRAEHVCGQLLVKDELRPGAHYLMAICHERRGDHAAAIESDQTAIYLDARFAMPRLHLGLMAKRLGDMGTARRELGEALELLGREDAGRILLFGGGFSREALIRFCRAEWERCGGTR
jgi:chemotaxis protein methyltransferase CheR